MSSRLVKVLLLLIIFFPLWSFLAWLIKPVKPINILIMDKTVLFNSGPEHRSFNWVLNHHKYAKPNRRFYRIKKDYYGFFPIERGKEWYKRDIDSFDIYQLDSLADTLDMIYMTDMYGIYVNEWYRDTITWKERSQWIYGGMSDNDLYLLKQLKKQHKLLLTEFNYYHHPTPEYIRKQAGDLINIKWTRWVGRYFDPLIPGVNEELPMWVVNNYMREHGGKWPFSKAGIVFARDDDWIEILEDTTHLNVKIPFIYTSEYGQKKYRMAAKVHYPFWFDISLPLNDSNLVVSTFRIEPNEKGDSIMQRYHIPKEFPAIMESTGPSPYYYFGADFSDNPIKMRSAYFAGSGWLDFLFYNQEYLKRSKFFYKIYR
ncbi:MAG: hypothetical protein J7L89_02970, partial [Bacteroidales bacterium]|nr:hypothetical protein [Bacteroidales bacterium]